MNLRVKDCLAAAAEGLSQRFARTRLGMELHSRLDLSYLSYRLWREKPRSTPFVSRQRPPRHSWSL